LTLRPAAPGVGIVFLIRSAGVEEKYVARRFIRIKRPIEVGDVEKMARFEPFDGFKVSFDIDFDHPAMDEDRRRSEIDFSSTSFVIESRPGADLWPPARYRDPAGKRTGAR
jgi:UDP-3-O-acyl-N-acetylglucosamine deacetylase